MNIVRIFKKKFFNNYLETRDEFLGGERERAQLVFFFATEKYFLFFYQTFYSKTISPVSSDYRLPIIYIIIIYCARYNTYYIDSM